MNDRTVRRRQFLSQGAAVLGASALAAPLHAAAASRSAKPWRIQRLSWAGLRLECAPMSLFIDPWITPGIWDGAWKGAIVPLAADSTRRAVLLTHAHNDHFDPPAIRELLGDTGSVICDVAIAEQIGSRGFRVRPARPYEPLIFGDAVVTAIPAVDGFNTPQVSWLISYQGMRILHAGDTLWHGGWWQVGKQYGPIDATFLPINGAQLPENLPASGVNATMEPEDAVAVAAVTRSRLLVPIHYGLHNPGKYEETPNAIDRLRRTAESRKVSHKVVAPGEWIELQPAG